MMQKYNNRSEVPEKYKWNLTDFFKDEKDFNKTLEIVKENTTKLSTYQGCTKNSEKLYNFLQLEVETIGLWEDLYVYAYLINDQELGNKESIERKNKCEVLNLELEKSISFFAPELLKLSKEEYKELFNNKKLLEYKDDLDRVYRDKDHILNENEEKIISSLVNSMNHFEDISSTMLNSLHDYGKIEVDGEDVVIATTNYRNLMKNRDKDIRVNVRNSFNKTIDRYSETNASLLSSYISMHETIAKIRGFSSSWERKMFNWNFNSEIFKTLVKVVERNIDKLQNYYKVKKKILGLDELTSYDLSLDISNNVKYTIEDAKKITIEAISILGEEYKEKFENIFNNKYIDYCQYKGKCSGAYSFSTMNHPSRILMSFNENFESVSTIIHEGGHNVHDQFVRENNPQQYRSTSSIVAEVASLTNECLLSSYLAKNGQSKEEKIAGISNILEVIISNLYGAVREGKMEEEMYEKVRGGDILTKEYMDELTYNSLSKYYGNEVKYDRLIKNSWVSRSHYYMNFYLYSYAISICVAASISKKILSGDKEILDKYINFLKTGSNLWPIDIYKKLGIDLEKEDVYQDACDYFNQLTEELIKIYEE